MPPAASHSSTGGRARKGKTKAKLDAAEEDSGGNKSPKLTVKNIVHCIDDFQHGRMGAAQLRRYGEFVVSEKLRNFQFQSRDECDFDRRVTSLKFHPSSPDILSFGTKSGEFVVRHMHKGEMSSKCVSWEGIGPGGSITDIAFCPFTSSSTYCSSIDGTVKVRDYVTKSEKTLLDTGSFERWYCSVSASEETGLVVAGDTIGVLCVMDKNHKRVFDHKLHKKKLNSIEFSKSRNWLFATASLDTSVKLWDLRKIDVKSPLETLPHVDPVNSAYFSRTNGNRLVTTDQHNEVRVYKGPLFKLETRIRHPHRQFQHLTPIKASWHPLSDLIVVGRYPDPSWPTYMTGELRTIDVLSAETGEPRVQLYSPLCSGITSLCSFNSTGHILATASGRLICYWTEDEARDSLPRRADGRLPKPPGPRGGGDGDDDDDAPPPSKRKAPAKKSAKCPKSKMSKLK